MITKLIHLILIVGSLLGGVLVYELLIRLSKDMLNIPVLILLIGIISGYGYGAATFMAMKGIHLFSKMD